MTDAEPYIASLSGTTWLSDMNYNVSANAAQRSSLLGRPRSNDILKREAPDLWGVEPTKCPPGAESDRTGRLPENQQYEFTIEDVTDAMADFDYDGDIEEQYPDDFEDAETEDEESHSRSLESPPNEARFIRDFRNLNVENNRSRSTTFSSASARSPQQPETDSVCSTSTPRKRGYSESLKSESPNEQLVALSPNRVAETKSSNAKRQRRSLDTIEDHDAMDIDASDGTLVDTTLL